MRVKTGEKTGESQSCLGKGEGILGMREGIEFFIRSDAFLQAEVDGAHDQFRAVAKFRKDLDGWLAVQIDGQIQDFAAVFDAIGGRVGPTASEVESNGAAGPDDLVFEDVPARQSGRKLCFTADEVAQAAKSGGFEFFPPGFSVMPQDGGAEHAVVDELHWVVVLTEFKLRQGGGRIERARGGFQVEAEEDAGAEMLEHRQETSLAQT